MSKNIHIIEINYVDLTVDDDTPIHHDTLEQLITDYPISRSHAEYRLINPIHDDTPSASNASPPPVPPDSVVTTE